MIRDSGLVKLGALHRELLDKAATSPRQPRLSKPFVAASAVAAEERDFVKAVYWNFPYVLGFVVLTFIRPAGS